jgi:hypothetical protein
MIRDGHGSKIKYLVLKRKVSSIKEAQGIIQDCRTVAGHS